MTHRERHTPEEAPARDATWTPPVNPSASASIGRRDAGSTNELGNASLWIDWYSRASAAQQQEALQRAIHQGVVYAHYLPAPAQPSSSPRSSLSAFLSSQIKEMAPLQPPLLEFHDGELDRMQREAVARAVATPDVCLIQGLPGTGKSRLIAEIILQAAQRGERILLLAPTAAALDGVLERLSSHPAVCPIRCLSPEENLAELPPASARLTVPERVRSYREITVPAARTVHKDALQTLETRSREREHWPSLESVTEQYEHLCERLRNLIQRKDGIAAEIEQSEPSGLYGENWRACERARAEAVEGIDGQLAGLRAELETTASKQAQLDGEWETIRPLAEARKGRRLWTGVWWRSLLRGGLREQVNELEVRRSELNAARQRLEQELTARRSERDAIESRCAAERRRLQDEEIARRRADLDKDIAAATLEQNALGDRWHRISTALSGEVVPSEISRQAVAAYRAAWERLYEKDSQRACAAEQWLQAVEEGIQTLPEKLAGCANVIAATTTALTGDAGENDPRTPPVFDLLILDQTHCVPEPELTAAARRARRWVLIGEPQTKGEAANNTPSRPGARHSPLATRHFFQRSWQHLHADPSCLPFAWIRSGDRLLCRLRPLATGQDKWIETEPVVDRPDIELRILSMPRQAPRIVEVLFPVDMGIAEAKRFIFCELEELAVQTCGRGLCWFETADEVILEFAHSCDREMIAVALERGICERVAQLPVVGGMDWHTCALQFRRADGWTRERAEEWIAERLGLRWPGRTVMLTTTYRFDSPIPFASTCPTCQKNRTADSTDKKKRDFKMEKTTGRHD